MLLEGKIALITGAGSGLGRAVSQVLAAEGACVVVADIVESSALETVQSIVEAGGTAKAITADVSKESDCARLVEAAVDMFGRLDVLDNNAAIQVVEREGAITNFTETDMLRMFSVNVFGVLYMCKYAMPAMAKTGGGTIINMSSAAGLNARPNMPLYVATKGAVLALTRSLALDGAPMGIRVNCIAPTAHDTEMWHRYLASVSDPEQAAAVNLRLIPLGRLGRPEELANTVVFLASDRSSYITGQAILHDGGSLAGRMGRS